MSSLKIDETKSLRALDKNREIPAEFQTSPIYYLLQTANFLNDVATKFFRENYDLNVTDVSILRLLYHEPNETSPRICYVSQFDKSVASRSLANLEKKKYALRQADPNDRRQQLWNLTDKGEEIVSQYLLPDSLKQQELFFNSFSEREKKQALVILSRLHKNAKNICIDKATIHS